jgi:hypothetical protein
MKDGSTYAIAGTVVGNGLEDGEPIHNPSDGAVIGKIITKTKNYDMEGRFYKIDTSSPVFSTGTIVIGNFDPSQDNRKGAWVATTRTVTERDILSTATANYDSEKSASGFKLDLENSRIDGYDLLLRGTSKTLGHSFVLDSGAPETPFSIGDDFKVSWDGTLNCNKVNSLNNDGNTDKVISIANNFYVS